MKQNHDMPFFLIIYLFSISTVRDIITPTQPLADNETLISSGGRFALGFFTPRNSNSRYVGLWFNLIPDHSILWVANCENQVIKSTGVLSITADGRLTITSRNLTVVWSTSATGLTSPVAQLLENGNLVIKQAGENNGNYAWQGLDYLTDTMLPGMKLGVDLTTGINHTVVAWNSYNDPSPGPYHVLMDIKGVPEVYFYQGLRKIWCSGHWYNWYGTIWDGMLNMGDFNLSFVKTRNQMGIFSYGLTRQTQVSKITINSMSIIRFQTWQPESNQWREFWIVPDGPCDNFAECSPYGLCDSTSIPVCRCLQGFIPENKDNWNMGDGHDGCVRETVLDCLNGTDGFAIVRSVKLPPSENSTLDMSLSLDGCKALCLKNCSCTAYASPKLDAGGCMIWTERLFDIRKVPGYGLDLYIQLAVADTGISPFDLSNRSGYTTGQSRGRDGATILIVPILVAGVLLLTFVCCLLWKKKDKKRCNILRQYSWSMDQEGVM